jgi:glycosyltransferase involved in cell wall biosynthesis
VAAFDGGGVRDWLTDGHTGLIIPPGNVLALASSINVLMRDPETATAMGRAGWEGVRKAFTPQAGIEAMVRVYEAVAGRAS